MKFFSKYKKVIAELVGIALRAKKANLISLPKEVKGASCENCYYWRDTSNEKVGYCAQSQVSVFITKKQVCNHWGHKDAVELLTRTKMNLEPDYRDMPPPANDIDFKFDKNGGLLYLNEEERQRAADAGMLSLPEGQNVTSCYNCRFSTSVGWCKNAHVNQPIHKDDRCNFWDYPGAMRPKK